MERVFATYSWKSAFFIKQPEDAFRRLFDEIQTKSVVSKTDVRIVNFLFFVLQKLLKSISRIKINLLIYNLLLKLEDVMIEELM